MASTHASSPLVFSSSSTYTLLTDTDTDTRVSTVNVSDPTKRGQAG